MYGGYVIDFGRLSKSGFEGEMSDEAEHLTDEMWDVISSDIAGRVFKAISEIIGDVVNELEAENV